MKNKKYGLCILSLAVYLVGANAKAAPAEWYYQYLPGDYDGNGYDDLCTYYPDKGTWSIWYNSNGTLTWKQSINFGFGSGRAVPGDYDGDGKTDIAIYDPAHGSWIIRDSSTLRSRTVQWGWSEAVPVPADYNGDGKDCTAVYNPADGAWMILFASGWTKTMKLGFPGAIPVPGDYNGDGREDIAVYIPANGNWQAVDVFTGQILLNINWGWSTASPIASDFNGSGRIDPSVYYNGTWYINFNNGITKNIQWGGGNVIPVPGHYRSYYSSYKHAQVAVYFPDSGVWSMKEFFIDFLDPWWLSVQFGWNQALPPPYKN